MSALSLRVFVPVCGFRKPYAREYLETERVPPPSTVYGFLLSLIGEENRCRYIGAKLAVALTKIPPVSKTLRTAWRIKSKNNPPGMGNNKRPDYQEILTGLEIGIWVDEGELAARLRQIQYPEKISRYGGLCLGESHDLVDEVSFSPIWKGRSGYWLMKDDHGRHPLPIWVDHVGSKGTRWGQFRLQDAPFEDPPENDNRWIAIRPPDTRVAHD